MRFFLLAPVLFGLSTMAQGLIDRQFPHLMVPIKQDAPSTVFGTVFTAEVSQVQGGGSRVLTEFIFDVPPHDATDCRLNFFINKDSPHAIWGDGDFYMHVHLLNGIPDKTKDTWNSHPGTGRLVATIKVTTDNQASIVDGGAVPCYKDETANFIITPADPAKYGGFNWFELDKPLHGLTYEMYK
ncbi:ubiquitin 3 binding protein But2 [Lophiotrema nucula]|uniref:Ubiquitin 3 binding protein But2 n=1 Tax=Lophiotrema nucula TaxID=690887 RepID=A0A6A5ZLJ2_9PLEO|nr:ubiquitin 3 binding protein But2 [Lophiotrema nucula]